MFYFVLSFYCCILASNASETKAAPKSTPKAGGGGGLFDDESGDDVDDPFSAKAPVKQEVPEEKSPPKKKVRFKDCPFNAHFLWLFVPSLETSKIVEEYSVCLCPVWFQA